jgi:hypothetical protein
VSPLLHDFEIDPTFASIDFENQDWYPPFEFNPPPYMNQADQNQKINNTVQVRSPFDAGRPQNKISSQPLLGAEVAPPRSSSKNYAILSQGSGRDIQRCQNPGPESLIRQLSELTIGLHEHSKKIPPQSIHDPILQSELGAEDTSANSRPQDYANYCLDETFQMTQDLINIYPFFISTFLCRESTGTGIVEPSAWRQYSVSEDPISQEIRPPIAPSLSNPLAVDHPSILLILSCHLRLIDIYEELFKHMEICIAQKGIACTPAQVSYVGTPLKIGSYVPPPSAAVPMQMLLLIQFASQLAEHAADLVSGLKRSPNGDGEGCLGEAVAEGSRDGKLVSCLLSADTVNCRASDMAQHLNSLRVKMLQMGFLA